MSEELTKKWENRQLEPNYYYLKLKNGDIDIQDNFIGGFLMSENNPIIEVLAPVPNYDEYKELVFKANKPANPLSDCMMTYDTEREKEIVAPLLEQIKNQGLTIKNLQNKLEDAETRIEELEQQNGFECGCVASRDEQLKEANELIKDYGDEYPNVVSDYIKKWGVK